MAENKAKNIAFKFSAIARHNPRIHYEAREARRGDWIVCQFLDGNPVGVAAY